MEVEQLELEGRGQKTTDHPASVNLYKRLVIIWMLWDFMKQTGIRNHCISTEWCYVTKKTCFPLLVLSRSKKHGGGCSKLLASSFPLQQLHSLSSNFHCFGWGFHCSFTKHAWFYKSANVLFTALSEDLKRTKLYEYFSFKGYEWAWKCWHNRWGEVLCRCISFSFFKDYILHCKL